MSAAAASPLRIERRGAICILTLDRPEQRNTLTQAMMAALGRALLEAESDPEVRVALLTGSGRTFCAGLDLREFGEQGAGDPERDEGAGAGYLKLLHGELAVPVVGAANGTAVAGGLELLLGCDLIVASDQAKFGLPEAKRGLVPGGNGTLLGARIPTAVALELLLTGEPVSAQRAYEVGLVNRVTPADQVLETALALAERIAANGPLAVRTAKQLVQLAASDLAAARRRILEVVPGIFASEDAREGARAYLEKRAPVWKGR